MARTERAFGTRVIAEAVPLHFYYGFVKSREWFGERMLNEIIID